MLYKHVKIMQCKYRETELDNHLLIRLCHINHIVNQ